MKERGGGGAGRGRKLQVELPCKVESSLKGLESAQTPTLTHTFHIHFEL